MVQNKKKKNHNLNKNFKRKTNNTRMSKRYKWNWRPNEGAKTNRNNIKTHSTEKMYTNQQSLSFYIEEKRANKKKNYEEKNTPWKEPVRWMCVIKTLNSCRELFSRYIFSSTHTYWYMCSWLLLASFWFWSLFSFLCVPMLPPMLLISSHCFVMLCCVMKFIEFHSEDIDLPLLLLIFFFISFRSLFSLLVNVVAISLLFLYIHFMLMLVAFKINRQNGSVSIPTHSLAYTTLHV